MDDLETVNFNKDTNINDLGKIYPKKMSGTLIAATKIVKKTPQKFSKEKPVSETR